MRYLIISLLFLLWSCSISIIKGLKKDVNQETYYKNTYFSNPAIDYVYKTKIDIYNDSFGGILIIKKIKENNHRILFTTTFGNKIFDFQIVDGSFKIIYIIEELNKKSIIKTLKNDFEILIIEHNTLYNVYTDQKLYVYQSKLGKGYNYYIVSENGILSEIIHSKKNKKNTIISFFEINNNLAKKIRIQHKNIPLSINLLYLNN